MYAQGQPIIILKEGTQRETGRSAQEKNIQAALAIANTLRSTLGPRGMDKMMVDPSGDVVITNDGATILQEMEVAHPAAKMIIEVSKTQDDECGDGTKSAVILAGELLRVAQVLLDQHVHPTVVTEGFKMANVRAQDVLGALARPIKPGDGDILGHVATTALASKVASSESALLARLAIEACRAVTERVEGRTTCDIDNVQVQRATGASTVDSSLVRGIILDKKRVDPSMPHRVRDAKILLAEIAFEVKKTEVEAKIQIRAPGQLQGFLAQEQSYVKGLVDKVVRSGANVLVTEKGIDDQSQHLLAKAGIYAVQRVKRADMEKLAKATGAQWITTLDDVTAESLGRAGSVFEEKIGDDTFTLVADCKDPKAVSILLRGGTQHLVEEMERALHDTLSVVAHTLEDLRVLPGGGASHMEVAMALRDYAPTVGGRQQMAIEGFADAVEIIPRTLAENAGLDEIDVLIELRRAHKKGTPTSGVNLRSGKVEDMLRLGVVEPLRVDAQALNAATEVAVMILRIDDVIASKAAGPGAPPGGGPPGGDGFGLG